MAILIFAREKSDLNCMLQSACMVESSSWIDCVHSPRSCRKSLDRASIDLYVKREAQRQDLAVTTPRCESSTTNLYCVWQAATDASDAAAFNCDRNPTVLPSENGI
jgi:hypothetical protein